MESRIFSIKWKEELYLSIVFVKIQLNLIQIL
jgi:hypothetical protein